MPQYYAFGLHIKSALDVPELLPMDMARADVCITVGGASTTGLPQPTCVDLYYQAVPGEFWFHVPDIARFHLTDGRRIVVDPEAGADEDSVRLYLLGSCVDALLHQRQLLVLHGMAMFIPLKNNTYRIQYLEGLGLQRAHLQHCSRLAAQIRLTRIPRPNYGFQLDALVAGIEVDLQRKGIVA